MQSTNLNVIIFGCGNIGLRHIQGLSKSAHSINVFAYNPKRETLDELKRGYQSVSIDPFKPHVTWWFDLDQLLMKRHQFDLAIISSTADSRTETVEQCFESFESRYWIFEKPLTQSSESLKKMYELCRDKKVWVNHPMRSMEWFKNIKSKLQKEKPLKITVSGPDIGLACNCSHYVDLANFFTGELPVHTNTSNLSSNWYPSKRKGFFETAGEMKVKFNKGTELSIISSIRERDLRIEGKSLKTGSSFSINEEAGFAHLSGGFIIKGRTDLQSELTGRYIDQLVFSEDCDLTKLKLAVRCYSPIIAALTEHWNQVYPDDCRDSVPIT